MEITEEKRAEIIQHHKDGIKEMRNDVDKMGKSVGVDNSAILKMSNIVSIMESMTDDEVVLLALEMDKLIADEL